MKVCRPAPGLGGRFRGVKKVIGTAALGAVGGPAVLGTELSRKVVSPFWSGVLGEARTDADRTPSTAKAWGATGAAVGAAVGRYLATPLGLVGVWMATQSLGPAAQLATTAVAAATTPFLRPGRVIMGTLGGAVGYVAGQIADRLGHQPSQELGQASAGFLLSQLPKRLLATSNSTPRVADRKDAREALAQAQPGDILLGHRTGLHNLSIMTEMAGGDGAYSHVGMVAQKGKVLDIHNGPAEENDRQDWLKFQHLAVLRPKYDSEASIQRTEHRLRSLAQEATYNLSMGIVADQDSKLQYCGKFVKQGLQAGAPEVSLEPTRWMGLEMTLAQDFRNSPDIETVYDSGADFWHYHLRHFS